MTRALLLVHDPAASRRDRIPGALAPALSARGIEHDVASLVSDQETAPDLAGYDLLIVLGSKESAYDDTVPWLGRELAYVGAAVELGQPVLGICFGGQLLARCVGGTVQPTTRPEHGFTTVETSDADLVPDGPWMQFHSDSFVPPPGTEIARNASGSQAFRTGRVLGVQFHPEITVDTFDSWFERWVAEGGMPGNTADLDALRAEVARRGEHSALLCDRLIGAFCTRIAKLELSA